MNNSTNFSIKEKAGQKSVGFASPQVSKLSSKAMPTLSLAIASICGFVAAMEPAYAKINVPTDSTASPLCIAGQAGCATDIYCQDAYV